MNKLLPFPRSFRTWVLAAAAAAAFFAWNPRTPAADPAAAPEVLQANDVEGIKGHEGAKVTVEGTPINVGENKPGSVRYLDFSKSHTETVTLVFFTKGHDDFTKEKLQDYVNKKIHATGKVGEFNGAVQVVINNLSDIEIQQ